MSWNRCRSWFNTAAGGLALLTAIACGCSLLFAQTGGGDAPVPIQRIDEALEGRQVERVRALRLRRDAEVHAAALRGVEEAARGGAAGWSTGRRPCC